MAHKSGYQSEAVKPFGLDQEPPRVDQDNRDVNFASVAPIQHRPENGTDSYVGLPGDGIVPG